MISVVILTYNEEVNVKPCIESVKSISDDIHILDSHSTDCTQTLAAEAGAIINTKKFHGYASQRNYALTEIKYKYDFVLMLDADERLTDSLANELLLATQDSETTMILCRRKDHFQGKWLKHSSGYPTWFPRIFKVGHCKVEREINEEYFTDGETRMLKSHLLHYPFNKGLSEWFLKHNRYSDMEASILIKGQSFNLNALFNSDPLIRRKNAKALVYSLPFRPIIVFLIFYIFKKGFLDGKPGLRFCLMKFVYEMMISLKASDINFKRHNK